MRRELEYDEKNAVDLKMYQSEEEVSMNMGMINSTINARLTIRTIISLASFFFLLSAAEASQEAPTFSLLSQDLVAQLDGEDSYDPFSDYSEFEEEADEEADINFFRNGRFFTLGFLAGYRGFTEDLGSLVGGSPAFGLFIAYFFDLRFALQVAFLTSSHDFTVKSASSQASASASFSNISLSVKYYFNTQNVTKGLADLNPYVIGGFSQMYRTINVEGEEAYARDSALGMDAGAGLEIPLLRKKMYFGIQAAYSLVSFKNENKEILLNGAERTGARFAGDVYTFQGILGVNF